MATFRPGDRVRKIGRMDPKDADPRLPRGTEVPNGIEGTVRVALDPGAYSVWFDGYRSKGSLGSFRVMAYQIAPLTDPQSDAFVESIKRLKPYDEPKVPTPIYTVRVEATK